MGGGGGGGTLMVQNTSTEAVKQVINIPQKIILVLAIRKGRLSYVASSCILTCNCIQACCVRTFQKCSVS